MARTKLLCALAPVLLFGAGAQALENQSSEVQASSSWAPTPDWNCERDPFDAARQVVCWERQFLTGGINEAFTPAMELKETKDSFVVVADVPGLDEKDLVVTLSGNRLAIRGQRPTEKSAGGEKIYTHERTFGSFERNLTLPELADGDHIDAKVDKGVLTLRVPKKTGLEAKRITVRGASAPETPMLGQNP